VGDATHFGETQYMLAQRLLVDLFIWGVEGDEGDVDAGRGSGGAGHAGQRE
jgi:hypothetical protein